MPISTCNSLAVPKPTQLTGGSPLKRDLPKVVARSVSCLGDAFVKRACLEEGIMEDALKRFEVNSVRRLCYKGLAVYLEARIRNRVFKFSPVCEALYRSCIEPFLKRSHPQPTCIRELINRFGEQLKTGSSFYQGILPRERVCSETRRKSSLTRQSTEEFEAESVTIGEAVESEVFEFVESETEILIAAGDYMEIETVSSVSGFSFLSRTGKSGFDTSSDRDSGRQSSRDVSVSESANEFIGSGDIEAVHESTHIGRDFLGSDLNCSAVASAGESSLKRVTYKLIMHL